MHSPDGKSDVMRISKGLGLALMLVVLDAEPSRSSAKVLARPVWRLAVQGDSTFACRVIQNDFAAHPGIPWVAG